MTGCARREEVFLEEMDSDEENSNRKAGEESTAYENNVAAGENPEKQSHHVNVQDFRGSLMILRFLFQIHRLINSLVIL